MGQVWEAHDIVLDQRVALKAARPDLVDRPDLTELLLREVRTARGVTHPNVCRIFDVVHHSTHQGSMLLISMELLVGETLAMRLQRAPPAPAEAIAIALQVADALTAIHSAGVVHGDLKPGNVFLVKAAGLERAVVTDFGLASSSHDPRRVTGGGTPGYVAPEVTNGAAPTTASDWWAFGAILRHLDAGPRTTGMANRYLQQLVARCRAEQPGGRPVDADDVRHELQRVARLGAAPRLTQLALLPLLLLMAVGVAPSPPPSSPESTLPQLVRALQNEARTLAADGHLAAATTKLEAARDAAPGARGPLLALAELFRQRGLDTASRQMLGAARLDPTPASRLDALAAEALAAELDGDWPRAIAVRQARAALADGDPSAVVELAQAQLDAGRLRDATETLAAFRRQHPETTADPRLDLITAGATWGDDRVAAAERAATLARRKGATLLAAEADLYLASERADSALAEASLAVFRAEHHPRDTAWALNALAAFAVRAGNYDTALAAAEEAHGVAQAAGNRRAEVDSLLNRYWIEAERADLTTAIATTRTALATARAAGYVSGIARSLRALGLLAVRNGRPEEAEDPLAEAVAMLEAGGDERTAVPTRDTLAWQRGLIGRWRDAVELYQRNYEHHLRVGEQAYRSWSEMQLGHALIHLGELSRAETLLLAAVEHAGDSPRLAARFGLRLAELALRRLDLAAAGTRIAAAAATADPADGFYRQQIHLIAAEQALYGAELGRTEHELDLAAAATDDPVARAEVRIYQARLALVRGEPAAAATLARGVLEEVARFPPLLFRAQCYLASALAALGRLDEAWPVQLAAEETAARLDDLEARSLIERTAADLHQRAGSIERALERATSALRLAERGSDGWGTLESALALAELERAGGHPELAQVRLHRLAPMLARAPLASRRAAASALDSSHLVAAAHSP